MIATQFLGVFIPSFIVLIDSQVCPRNNTWECSDGGCIWSDRRCDDNPHCRDRSDEKNCANWTCSPKWWKCGTDLCIWHRDRCDGRMDCADGSDERNCENWSCGKFRWKCGDGTLCIGQHLRCDGRTQCTDGSDEQNCENWLCGDDQWKCGDGTLCIRLSLQCDGRTQCADGSDEQNCDTAAVKSLTLDGHNDTITVDGDGHRTLNLTCRVFGRVKGLVKIKKESDVFGNVHFPFYKLDYRTLGTYTFDVVMTLSDVTCDDMGRYTCAVGQDSKSIQLNVSCEGMKYGGNLTCPSAWKIGQNVKLTLTLDRSIWPSICRTDPDRREAWFEVIRWNDTGRQSIMCTVVNITLPGACQGAFTPGTIGCGCVSKTKWHFTLELNFVMDLSYFGNWSVDTHCLRTDFSKPIQFNVTPECNVRLTCEDKTYGARCHEPCGHCADDQTCNASTGHCPACQDGWLPPLCTQGQEKQEEEGLTTGEKIAIGVSAGASASGVAFAWLYQAWQIINNLGWMPNIYWGDDKEKKTEEDDTKGEESEEDDHDDELSMCYYCLICLTCGGCGLCVTRGKMKDSNSQEAEKSSEHQEPPISEQPGIEISADKSREQSYEADNGPRSVRMDEMRISIPKQTTERKEFTKRYFDTAGWLADPITHRKKKKLTNWQRFYSKSSVVKIKPGEKVRSKGRKKTGKAQQGSTNMSLQQSGARDEEQVHVIKLLSVSKAKRKTSQHLELPK